MSKELPEIFTVDELEEWEKLEKKGFFRVYQSEGWAKRMERLLGGTLYTQEDAVNGTVYVKGFHLVNHTGIYAVVVPSSTEQKTIELRVKITDKLLTDYQEKLEDELADWLKTKGLHGEVESLSTGNIVQIDHPNHNFDFSSFTLEELIEKRTDMEEGLDIRHAWKGEPNMEELDAIKEEIADREEKEEGEEE
jgi:hypothetical protein